MRLEEDAQMKVLVGAKELDYCLQTVRIDSKEKMV